MATFLDVTGLQYFSNFFVFIFVWLVLYAILGYTKVLGDNKAVHIVIGLVVALLVIISPVATGAVAFISPWFVLVFVFLIFVVMGLRAFGYSDVQLSGQLKSGFIAVIVLILVIGVLSYVREQSQIPSGEDVDYSKTVSVIFHPKVLGIVFVLIIAVFTIVLMATKQA